jgi:hypothetical protein
MKILRIFTSSSLSKPPAHTVRAGTPADGSHAKLTYINAVVQDNQQQLRIMLWLTLFGTSHCSCAAGFQEQQAGLVCSHWLKASGYLLALSQWLHARPACGSQKPAAGRATDRFSPVLPAHQPKSNKDSTTRAAASSLFAALTLWCSKADAEQLHLVLAICIVYC